MLLLVIGVVAVIIAVLVAVFLVTRRRGDDDEPGGRQTVRDRLHGRARDTRWSTDPRMARKPAGRGTGLSRRPAGEPRGYGGPDRGYEPVGFDQSRGYEPSPRGYGERPARGREGQPTERLQPARRDGRYQDSPEPVGARDAAASRRPSVGTDTGPGPALYDTGPSAATTRISADPDLADSDVFPRVRADIPETEARAARPKNQAKGRGRPSRGRHDDDDDDWPSTEWDKLSDEQYWAELSADKPLATTARSAQPSTAPAAAKPAPAAKPGRGGAQPPASGRAAPRPPATPDAGPDVGGHRQPADRPGRTGSRPATPRRPDGADTDPGRPGLLPAGAAQATERLPVRNRHQPADPPPSAAPFMPAPPVPAVAQPAARGQAGRVRADDDPLTSPTFARGAAADDSRSYRAPRRTAAPGPGGSSPGLPRAGAADELTGSYPGPGGSPAYPGSPDGYPRTADAYPSSYPGPSGGYPPAGREGYTGPSRGRDGYPGPAAGYEAYPGARGGSRDYPASGGRHGYLAGQADRTDPGAARTDPGASRPSPGRRRSTPARQSQAQGSQAQPQTPGWGSDRGAPAETPSTQAGMGNPYGSYVDTAPPAPTSPAPRAAAAVPQTPARTAPPAPPRTRPQAPATGNSYPGYTTGPTPAYSDPYRPGPAGYAAGSTEGRVDQGTTWYPAPPAAPATPPSPASAYPYQPDPAYPVSAEYGTQPGQAGYPGTPPAGTRGDTRYRNGQTEDPYAPGGYSGYHSRQG